MPHRTTYFFPRQFPDRNFNASSKLVADHEKKFVVDDGTSEARQREEVTLKLETNKDATTCAGKSGNSNSFSGIIHGLTGDKIHGRQLIDFVKWLSDKKKKEKSQAHVDPVKIRLYDNDDSIEEEEEELSQRLLPLPPPPPPVVDCDRRQDSLRRQSSNESNYSNSVDHVQGKERGFERQVSLQRLSSAGSTSYAGSLFSGTTLDGNWSSTTTGILKDSTVVKEEAEAEAEEEGLGAAANVDNGVAQRYKEGYYLLLMFAKRLIEQATLVTEPLLLQERRIGGSSDAEIVSYRLWVWDLSQV